MLEFFGIIKNNISAGFKFAWSALKTKFAYLFIPAYKYEEEIQELVQAYREASELYELVAHGENAEQLFKAYERQAQEAPSEETGQANLLLSVLYCNDINAANFQLKKDEQLSRQYHKKAVECLGGHPSLSGNYQKSFYYIRAGGQSSYALEQLHANAKLESCYKATLASKVLSFIYTKGIKNNNYVIPPNLNLAEKFTKQALSGLQRFTTTIVDYTKKLVSSFYQSDKTTALLKQLAETNIKCAQYHYARRVEDNGAQPEEFLGYYQRSASSTKTSPLAFASEGFAPAIEHMVDAHQLDFYNLTNTNQESSHYRFQLLLRHDHPENKGQFSSLLDEAAIKGNPSACLQVAWYYIEKSENVKLAADFLSKAECKKELWSEYDKALYEKLCLSIGKRYEELFINRTAPEKELTLEAKENLQKAIFHFQKIPTTSKHYTSVQYQIGHCQLYNLKNNSAAIASLEKSCENGNIPQAVQAVKLAFKHFWDSHLDKLSATQKAIVRDYEKADNKHFWDKVEVSSALELTDDGADSVTLLKKIIMLLKDIDLGRKASRKIPLFELNELDQLLVTAENKQLEHTINSMRHSPLGLLDMFTRDKPELRSRFTFLSGVEADKPSEKGSVRYLLNTIHAFLVGMRLELVAPKKRTYSEVVEDVYLKFVIAVCQRFLTQQKNLTEQSRVNLFPICAGGAR